MAPSYESVELVGVSASGFDDAVRAAVRRASQPGRALQWVEVLEQRAELDGAEIREFQVRVRVWFEV